MPEKINHKSCHDCMHTSMGNIFSGNDFSLLECNKTEMYFSPNEVIIKQGLYVSQVLFLTHGMVKVVLEGANNKHTILQFVEENNFIALPVIGNPDKYPFSIVAMTDCRLCVIKKEAMVNIMDQNIKANKYLLNHYHTDYIFLYNKITTLSTRNNIGKLTSALLYIQSNGFKRSIFDLISRKELAQLASISIESTNKILAELKKDNTIDIQNNKIIILKPEVIEKLSTVG